MDTSEQPPPFNNPTESDRSEERSNQLVPRLAWILYYEQTRDPLAVCNKFHITRKTFYKWLKRYHDSHCNSISLLDQSRKPHHSPLATPESKIHILREAKEQTGFGQRRLRIYLMEHYNISLSERTIWRLLKQDEEHLRSQQETSQAI